MIDLDLSLGDYLAGQTWFFPWPARLPCSSICRDKSLLKHYVGRDRDKSYNIVSVPAKSGQLATMR